MSSLDIHNYAQLEHFHRCFVIRKFACSLHVDLGMTVLHFQFQKRSITGTERKSASELQFSELGTKQELKGRM
jgi:hypothetical protein